MRDLACTRVLRAYAVALHHPVRGVTPLCVPLHLQYLLAMVYVYFRRANLTLNQYTRTNFFAAL